MRTSKLGDVLNFCAKALSKSQSQDPKSVPVPIQNAIYVEAKDGKSAHLKSYVAGQYIVEYIDIKKPTNATPAKVDEQTNQKQISKLNELFTPDQIEELKLGKQHNVNIKVYGNNKLSAPQMREIRLSLESGINPKHYSDPSFKPDCMKAYRIQTKYGVNISQFINPEYNVEQIFELSTAYLSGVNLQKLADPKKPATQMAKERIEMETELWKQEDDISTKEI